MRFMWLSIEKCQIQGACTKRGREHCAYFSIINAIDFHDASRTYAHTHLIYDQTNHSRPIDIYTCMHSINH